MKRLIPLFIISTLSCTPAVQAADDMEMNSTSTLQLAPLLQTVVKENPELSAARKKWEAAKQRIAQEWTPEKPRVDIERMYAPRDTNPFSGATEKNIAITQELPFPTSLYLRGKRARQEASVAEAEYKAKEREILSRTKSAYAMLYLTFHTIHIFEENAALMKQFSQVAESRYVAGSTMQSDVLKAQVEYSRMLNMLVTLEQEKETNQAMLNTLLNQSPDTPLGMPEDPKPIELTASLMKLQALAAEKRPDLQRGAAEVSRAQTSLSLARSEYLPDLMLQYRQRTMTEGMNSHDAMIGFGVPLWFWKQNAMVREARADQDMAKAEYQAMKNMAQYDVKSLYVKVQTDYRLITLFETSVLPQAQQALTVAQAGFQGGKTSFLDLLDAARTFLNFRLEHYQHLADYQQSRSELERVVGIDLEEVQ